MTTECEASPSANTPDLDAASRAVALCTDAWTCEHQSVLETTQSRYLANDAASDAYQRNLPTLIGMDNIRIFIACVANGMLIGAIDGAKASRLLYAAQIAKAATTPSSKKIAG